MADSRTRVGAFKWSTVVVREKEGSVCFDLYSVFYMYARECVCTCVCVRARVRVHTSIQKFRRALRCMIDERTGSSVNDV